MDVFGSVVKVDLLEIGKGNIDSLFVDKSSCYV